MRRQPSLQHAEVINALQDARLILLCKEENERAFAQKRLMSRGLSPTLVMEDPRYVQVQAAAEATHKAIGKLVNVLLTAGPT